MVNVLPSQNKGFSLVEMIVVIGIVGVIAGVVFFNAGAFTSQLGLGETTSEIATTIRQAQAYGTLVKESVAGAGDFGKGYGIFFDTAYPQSYYLFVDKNNNNYYDGNDMCASGSECVEKGTMKNPVTLSSFCGTDSAGVRTCSLSSVSKVSVMFVRPDPDAHIYLFASDGTLLSDTYTSVEAVVWSPQSGKTATVLIQNNGQISIK